MVAKRVAMAVVASAVTVVLGSGPGVAHADGRASDGAAGAAPNWHGLCYDAGGDNWWGGWCDGTGPDQYRATVYCDPIHNKFYGPWRWFGDRRGSYAYCPTNNFVEVGEMQYQFA
jgi:hypothetical protein